MDFSIIRGAGVTHAEFAQLCQVSRCTVSLWCTGRFSPNRFLAPIVEKTLADLQQAKARGYLPLRFTRREKPPADARLRYIVDAINMAKPTHDAGV